MTNVLLGEGAAYHSDFASGNAKQEQKSSLLSESLINGKCLYVDRDGET